MLHTVRLEPGTLLGPYEVIRLLGVGGMGEVYLASDTRLSRTVALKVIHSVSDEPGAQERFLHEAQSVAALAHPHICVLHDVRHESAIDFLVMEYVEGETLADRLSGVRLGRPMSISEALRMAVQIAEALAHAHSRGIVHGDLKSANVIVARDNRVKVLDFGLARRLGPPDVSELTRSRVPLAELGTVSGTLAYMAPEMLRGELPDTRADLWALGIVLYEMIAGRQPFSGRSAYEMSAAILCDSPPPLPYHIELGLQAVIRRCLAKNPSERYQSAVKVRAALEALTAETPQADRRAAKPTKPGRRAKKIRSLAVLPLQNLSHDPGQEYFAEGMTEALITDLAKMGVLKVISRTSVMRYKGAAKAVPEIAGELGVDAVVEGSVLLVGDRVRITAQLIHAVHDEHLWAESYERDLRDVLSLQREIARAIADEVRVRVARGTRTRLVSPRAVDPEVYAAYLQGRYHWNRRTPESIARAMACFEQAIARDPGYGLACAGLADCYILGAGGSLSRRESMERAKAAATRALELDHSLSEAHASLAAVAFRWEWDWAGAEGQFRRAIELNPAASSVRHGYALFLAALGRFPDALSELTRAHDVDPLSLVVATGIGRVLDYARRYDDAIDQYRRTLEFDPRFAETHFDLAMAFRHKGAFDEALAAGQQAVALAPDSLVYRVELACTRAVVGDRADAEGLLRELTDVSRRAYVSPGVHAYLLLALGRIDEAFDKLNATCDERGAEMVYLKVDPDLDPVRADPRFEALLRRVGFPR